MNNYQISEPLDKLLIEAVETDLNHLRNRRMVQPWLLTAGPDGGDIEIFVFADLDHMDAKNEARKIVREKSYYVFGFEGRISLTTGEKISGLFYEIGERGQKAGFNYMIGYERQADGNIQILEEYNGFRGKADNFIL